MKKADIEIGAVYEAKVSGRIVPVRIDSDRGEGLKANGMWGHAGWNATNLDTKRKIIIRSAQRLRRRMVTLPAKDGA